MVDFSATAPDARTSWAHHLACLTARFLIIDAVMAPLAMSAGVEGLRQGKVLGGILCLLGGAIQLLSAGAILGVAVLITLQAGCLKGKGE